MRISLCLAASICVISTLCSAEEPLPDGFYVLVEKGGEIEVERTHGGKIQLGKQLATEFGDVSIRSMANDNSRYRLQFDSVPSFPFEGHVAFVCDGVCEMIGSHSEPKEDGTIQLGGTMSGRENAAKVAERLGVTLIDRRHPGHILTASWRPLQESYKVGEPVVLELTIKNSGNLTVHFVEGGQQRGPRDNQFRFIARSVMADGKAVPDTGSAVNFGGPCSIRTIEPGKVFKKQIDITSWFKFRKVDTYRVTGIYELDLYDGDFHHAHIWDDFVVGECYLKIEETQADQD